MGTIRLEFTLVSIGWAVYALAALVLIAFLFRAEHHNRGHLGLALLLGQQAFGTAAAIVMFSSRDDRALFLGAFHLGAFLWLLWGPAVFFAGATLLEGSRKQTWIRLVCGVGALPPVAVVAYGIVDPTVIFAGGGFALSDLATQMLLISFVALAIVVGLLAWEALTTPLPKHRAQFALLALAFGVEGAFHAAQNLVKETFMLDFHGLKTLSGSLVVLTVLPSLILAAVILAIIVFSLRAGVDPAARKWARVVVASLVVSALTGVLTSRLIVGEEFRDPTGLIHVAWDLTGLCLLVFAGLRYQLFTVEMHARRGVVVSCFLGLALGVFIALQQVVGQYLSERALAGVPASSVVAGSVVSIAAIPLARVGQVLGKKAFPTVDLSAAYERRRSEEIYEAAVEGALMDGNVSPSEALSLRKLRETLVLTDHDHGRIEARVRSHMGSGRPGAA